MCDKTYSKCLLNWWWPPFPDVYHTSLLHPSFLILLHSSFHSFIVLLSYFLFNFVSGAFRFRVRAHAALPTQVCHPWDWICLLPPMMWGSRYQIQKKTAEKIFEIVFHLYALSWYFIVLCNESPIMLLTFTEGWTG